MAAASVLNSISHKMVFTGKVRQICWQNALSWRRTCATESGLPKYYKEIDVDDEFRVLYIPGHTQLPGAKEKTVRKRRETPPPRYKSMPVDQNWPSVWPSAHTFKWSVVPFPVRMGMVCGDENQGIPPGKYANAELMKLPNFLHLSPVHIKQHCAALKKLCTPWPEGLETDEQIDKHFPVRVTSCDYILDRPSVRDPRSRVVTLQIKLSHLDLDYHARDKLLRLVGQRYNPKTDVLTLEADRCPLKKQNYDFLLYVLTALYHESWKTEPWEELKTEADMEYYKWDITTSKKTLLETVQREKSAIENKPSEEPPTKVPSFLSELPSLPSEQDILELDVVKEYKEAVSKLHNDGEDVFTLNKYKDAVAKLLFNENDLATSSGQ